MSVSCSCNVLSLVVILYWQVLHVVVPFDSVKYEFKLIFMSVKNNKPIIQKHLLVYLLMHGSPEQIIPIQK